MALTDATIKTAKWAARPKKDKPGEMTEAPVKYFDRDGLALLVFKDGGKRWRLKYRALDPAKGKLVEKNLALGVYPEVTLAAARTKAAEARLDLGRGVDPIGKKQALKQAGVQALAASGGDTFEPTAREWWAEWSLGKNEAHSHRVLRRLELYLFPSLGRKPIGKIGAPELLKAIKTTEKDGGPETAHRVLTIFGQVFSFAVRSKGAVRERDITRDVRKGLAAAKEKHLAAVTHPDDIGRLIRATEGYHGYAITKFALLIAPYVFVRPGELRQAEWSEFNLDRAKWEIPAERMKTKIAHTVPLARQVVRLLRELHAHTGKGRFLFPSPLSSSRPMSDNTITAALRRMGFTGDEMTAHGFRAMARTALDEQLRERVEWIEMQLAHKVTDRNGKAYNRTAFMADRTEMMQRWADWLDQVAVAG